MTEMPKEIYANDDNSWCDNYSCCLGKEYILKSEHAALQAENERLREALQFYAKKYRYDNDIEIDRGDGLCDYSCSILEDEGKLAREALNREKAGV